MKKALKSLFHQNYSEIAKFLGVMGKNKLSKPLILVFALLALANAVSASCVIEGIDEGPVEGGLYKGIVSISWVDNKDCNIEVRFKQNDCGIEGNWIIISTNKSSPVLWDTNVLEVPDGSYCVKVQDFVDTGQQVFSGEFIIDNKPPQTSLEIGEPKYGDSVIFVNSSTLISLNANDSASPTATFYKINNGEFQSYSGSINISGEDGDYDLTYYSIDYLENKETEKTISLILDNTPPSLKRTISEGDTFESRQTIVHSGNNSWGTDISGNWQAVQTIMNSILESPEISLSGLQHPALNFWLADKSNGSPLAEKNVEVSDDNGISWKTIQTFPQETQGDWVKSSASLAEYAGKTVIVRFVYKTSGFATQPGWFIDDFEILGDFGTVLHDDFESGALGWKHYKGQGLGFDVWELGTPSIRTSEPLVVSPIALFNLDYNENGSGLKTVLYYCIDCNEPLSTPQTYIEPFTLESCGYGVCKLIYQATDNLGNYSNGAENVFVDSQGPVSKALWLSKFHKSSFLQVEFNVEDYSFVDFIELWYRINGGNFVFYTFEPQKRPWNQEPIIFKALQEGNFEFYTIATDWFGNREEVPEIPDASTIVDWTPPKVKLKHKAIVSKEGIDINFEDFNSTDELSGIKEFRWEFGDSLNLTGQKVSHKYSGKKAYDATLTVIDNANNEASERFKVIVGNIDYNVTPSITLNFDSIPDGQFYLDVNEISSEPPENGGFYFLGKYFEINSDLPEESFTAAITLNYPDSDGDGIVDGSGINEKDLDIYYYSGKDSGWKKLKNQSKDFKGKKISAETTHFSIFALMQEKPKPTQPESPKPEPVIGGSRGIPAATPTPSPTAPTPTPSPSITPFPESTSTPSLEETPAKPKPQTPTLPSAPTGFLGLSQADSKPLGAGLLALGLIIAVAGFLSIKKRKIKE